MDGLPMDVTQDCKAIAKGPAEHIGVLHMYGAVLASIGAGNILRYLAVAAAAYLLVTNRTNWRTNTLTALLVPYLALNLPSIVVQFSRSEIGYWIAFIAVVVQLFFPTHIPSQSELPACLVLLLVTAPNMLVNVRSELPGEMISVCIGSYLVYEHIFSSTSRAAGGLRKSVAQRGVPITTGILLLFVAPCWQLFLDSCTRNAWCFMHLLLPGGLL